MSTDFLPGRLNPGLPADQRGRRRLQLDLHRHDYTSRYLGKFVRSATTGSTTTWASARPSRPSRGHARPLVRFVRDKGYYSTRPKQL
jgi:hypothetical protein